MNKHEEWLLSPEGKKEIQEFINSEMVEKYYELKEKFKEYEEYIQLKNEIKRKCDYYEIVLSKN